MKKAIALAFLAAVCAQAAGYPNRWVFVIRSLQTDRDLEEIREIARTASAHGLNGLVLSAGLDRLDLQPPAFLERVRRVKQICEEHKLELIPQIFSAGYGGSVLAHNRNLAEGIPVRDALFVVSGGEARLAPDPPVAIANGGLEEYDGNRAKSFQLQDRPGELSFIDTAVFKEGAASLRFENFARDPNGHGRLMQEVAVKPRRCYRVTVWVKTEGLGPKGVFRVQALAPDGRALAPWDPGVPADSDWRRLTLGFNSLDYDRVRIYIGVWRGREGKFWVDGLAIEEVGLVNVLRRPGTPVTVRGEESGEAYEEGRDYARIFDPQLTFRFDHDAPPIRLLPGSRIRDGRRLRVDYYHGLSINSGQVTICMSEDEVYRIWQEQARRLHELLGADKYLLSMDEIRAGGSDEACQRRQMSMAEILGDCITRQFDMLREQNPSAEVFIWSDMLDPNHNARANYYLVEGDYTGSWEHVPKDLRIVTWYFDKRYQSLQHFSTLGFFTLAGAYYDGDTLDNPKGWLEALSRTPGATGIMYTTWRNKYALLADFGGLVSQSNGATQAPEQDARNSTTPNTDTHFTMPEYKTPAAWEARKARLRKQILFAAGLEPMPEKTPLKPLIFGRIENKDYSVEKVLLETMPGFYLGGNLYRPLGRKGKFPAIATPHGHWTYGRLEHQPLGSIPARAINFARQGYVVFAYDMVGYTDTVQTPHAFGGPAEQLWSFGPLGLQLWDSIRVIDFLQSLEEVDPERIAMTGASGGGTQTFLAAAVDDRVKWSAPVNMLSAIMQGGSPCENAPGLRVGAFNVEFGAMMAPRPMLMVSASGDWTRNTPREEFPAIRRIYELYGTPENVETIQIDAPHNYNQASREAVYRFFGKQILGDADPKKFSERNVRLEKLQDMLALHNRRLPENALDYKALFEQWKALCRRQFENTREREALRERLALALGAEWPAEAVRQGDGEKVVLGRAGQGDRVPAIWLRGRGAPALVVDPAGAEAARKSAFVEQLVRAQRPVLLIDAFQTGSAAAPRDRSHRYFLTFNRSDDANRVQDILTALRFLAASSPGKIELAGVGKAGIWCLFAAAVAPIDLKLSADLGAFRGQDEEFIRDFFVPGIQRAGGLEAALRLTEARR